MSVKFVCPVVPDESVAGVYKITFDRNSFYIGSSLHLKLRLMQYKCYIYRCKKSLSKPLQNAYNTCNIVEAEVLEVVKDIADLKKRETYFIEMYFNDKILNRSKNGYSNKGVHWTKQERESISKGMIGMKRSAATRKKMSMSKREYFKSISAEQKFKFISSKIYKVNHFDSKGNLIATYSSVRDAAINTGLCSASVLSKIKYGEPVKCNGHRFGKASSDAPVQIISNPIIKNKRRK